MKELIDRKEKFDPVHLTSVRRVAASLPTEQPFKRERFQTKTPQKWMHAMHVGRQNEELLQSWIAYNAENISRSRKSSPRIHRNVRKNEHYKTVAWTEMLVNRLFPTKSVEQSLDNSARPNSELRRALTRASTSLSAPIKSWNWASGSMCFTSESPRPEHVR